MNMTVILMMILSGLSFLPSCSYRLYILVNTQKTWTDAQTYCRSKYSDLAIVQNVKQLAGLNQLIGSDQYVWIGLYPDIGSWRWSLENQDYYTAGGARFRNWASGEPSAGLSYYKACVALLKTGGWVNKPCINQYYFICYNGKTAKSTSSSFIFVSKPMTWVNAQRYCRQTYTDLASVRNPTENEQMRKMTVFTNTWIGLYRDSWKWSDGSPVSVSNWGPAAPTGTFTDACVASNLGRWTNTGCSFQNKFTCFVEPAARKQVVQVVLEKSDSSVDMEELKEEVLQKFSQTLKDQGLEEDVRLSWVEGPDGKIFQKIKRPVP
ncbi:Macrophage mannose receptor 1 [Channa argus]|uniref:Macrophage mannose receptor 1 n=1 Tax=Channa argus TaxID=215402 RepID=A0A6G1QE29_CHAAH|nr:Macrophage mannose receptor 1 [Channa argus]